MSPIQERLITGDIRPNLDQALCFTCWSAGKVVKQIIHGYAGSDPVTEQEHESVMKASQEHLTKKGQEHNVVIYHFENESEEIES